MAKSKKAQGETPVTEQSAAAGEVGNMMVAGGRPLATPTVAVPTSVQYGADLAKDYIHALGDTEKTFRERMLHFFEKEGQKPEHCSEAVAGIQAYRDTLTKEEKAKQQFQLSRLIRVHKAGITHHDKVVEGLKTLGINALLKSLPRDARGAQEGQNSTPAQPTAEAGIKLDDVVEWIRNGASGQDVLVIVSAGIEALAAQDRESATYLAFIGESLQQEFRAAQAEFSKAQLTSVPPSAVRKAA